MIGLFGEPLSDDAKLIWERVLFVLGIIALGVGLYIAIFHYEDLPEYTRWSGRTRKLVILPLLPGIILMYLSRVIQNQRRANYEVMLGSGKKPTGKKKKVFRWKE